MGELCGARDWREPCFAPCCPTFIVWRELIRGVKGTEMKFNFISALGKDRRATARTKTPTPKGTGGAGDCDRSDGILGRSVKERAVMFAAIHAVANPNPVGRALGDKSNVAAGAAAGIGLHDVPLFDFENLAGKGRTVQNAKAGRKRKRRSPIRMSQLSILWRGNL